MDNYKGVDEPLRIRKFEVGDLVFAKLKGYPPWPSKINQIESIISGGKEKVRYNVFFYGTHQSSILRSSSLYHYDTYAKSIVDKWGRKPKFHHALKELEREMMDKITYLNQLRTTTPDSQWCHGFNTACESLVSEIDNAQERAKSKNHRLPKRNEQEIEEEIMDESRKLGYEVMYVERIPFPDTPESMIVLSLSFNKEWVKEESQRLREEERMMNCFVRIKPFPPEYAHLDPGRKDVQNILVNEDLLPPANSSAVFNNTRELLEESIRDISDGSDEEAVETCPVCRLCFFSQADLRKHEKTVHGAVSTAESLFDQLTSGPDKKKDNVVPRWKGGFPLDSLI
ncbi:hypothetical protein ONE63_009230 [Megalurothrips usitatus]|uniref:PWWP domain-containing protein n=1 Tax=Megalurothrips usitatus TaxID=439358 RepID=A0AAV7XQM7_9NEOP|nr:hypothetical protein ONE63_009230 [Megalurothrips usitatus]